MLGRTRGRQPGKLHYHQSAADGVIFCWHKCRSILFSPGFWLGTTLGFPIEHLIWQKLWPFYLVSQVLGLT